jgi:hypothetical protein
MRPTGASGATWSLSLAGVQLNQDLAFDPVVHIDVHLAHGADSLPPMLTDRWVAPLAATERVMLLCPQSM